MSNYSRIFKYMHYKKVRDFFYSKEVHVLIIFHTLKWKSVRSISNTYAKYYVATSYKSLSKNLERNKIVSQHMLTQGQFRVHVYRFPKIPHRDMMKGRMTKLICIKFLVYLDICFKYNAMHQIRKWQPLSNFLHHQQFDYRYTFT